MVKPDSPVLAKKQSKLARRKIDRVLVCLIFFNLIQSIRMAINFVPEVLQFVVNPLSRIIKEHQSKSERVEEVQQSKATAKETQREAVFS